MRVHARLLIARSDEMVGNNVNNKPWSSSSRLITGAFALTGKDILGSMVSLYNLRGETTRGAFAVMGMAKVGYMLSETEGFHQNPLPSIFHE